MKVDSLVDLNKKPVASLVVEQILMSCNNLYVRENLKEKETFCLWICIYMCV